VNSALIAVSRCGQDQIVSFRISSKKKIPTRGANLDAAIRTMTYHCPNLEEIGLSYFYLREKTLLDMVEHLEKITRFYFKGSPVTSRVLQAIGNRGTCELLDLSAQGKPDDLRNNSWMRGLPFSDESFLDFGKKCKDTLTCIRLNQTTFDSGEVLQTFFSTCRNLQRVAAGVSVIDDDAIEVLVHNNPSLTHIKISLSKVSDRGLDAIARSCHNLIHLDARFNEGTTVNSLVVLTRGVCKKMQILSVYLPNVPADQLIDIFTSFPELIKLNLAQSLLDDDTLIRIAKTKPRLFSLNVSETHLSNDGIESLEKFENLTELSIGLERVNESTIRIIPKSCPKLKILRVRQQTFSHQAIISIIKAMSHLIELEFVCEGDTPLNDIYSTIEKHNPKLNLICYEQDEEDDDDEEDEESMIMSDLSSDDEVHIVYAHRVSKIDSVAFCVTNKSPQSFRRQFCACSRAASDKNLVQLPAALPQCACHL